MTSKFMSALTKPFKRKRRNQLPRDIRRLSPHIRADIGYPASDEDVSIKDFPYNFRV